jgi:2-keto-4-pentenoate hydratase/2-oxohepta-3-ene-1,7-dioic acid hydratase in catechol pathway
MKLVTYRDEYTSLARLGALVDAETAILDVQAAHVRANGGPNPAFASMQDLIEAGEGALDTLRTLVDTHDPGDRVAGPSEGRLLAPLPRPVQMRDCLCFEEHLIRATQGLGGRGDAPPHPMLAIFRTRPFWYKCNRFAVTGPDQVVTWPAYSRLMDYECEMAMVIGRKGTDVPVSEAASYIFGYTIFNDFSARDVQAPEMSALGPAKSKDFDNANSLGPCIVTADAFDPYAAKMISRVNGEVQNVGVASEMHYTFEDLIAYISQSETLHPGEILGSGTVGGGSGLEQGRFLQSGDVIELEIEGIGVLRNTVVAGGAGRA